MRAWGLMAMLGAACGAVLAVPCRPALADPPEVVLVASPDAPDSEIAGLIDRIEVQVAEGQMWAPAGDNALEKVRRILELAPAATPKAVAEINAMPRRLRERAAIEDAAGRDLEARRFMLFADALAANGAVHKLAVLASRRSSGRPSALPVQAMAATPTQPIGVAAAAADAAPPPEPAVAIAPTPAAAPPPEPAAEILLPPAAEPSPEPVAAPLPTPIAEPSPEPAPAPAPTPIAEPSPAPAVEPPATPIAEPSPEPAAAPPPTPVAAPSPEPAPAPPPATVAAPPTTPVAALPPAPVAAPPLPPAATAVPAPRPATPAAAPLPPAVVATLIRRGQAMLAIGDISAARLLYERAALAGSGEAAAALGRTYDSEALARLGTRGIQPDPKMAVAWYRRAVALGDTASASLLQRLEANGAR